MCKYRVNKNIFMRRDAPYFSIESFHNKLTLLRSLCQALFSFISYFSGFKMLAVHHGLIMDSANTQLYAHIQTIRIFHLYLFNSVQANISSI